jgi:GTP diphosphokinase / guanosine-3',5'-bis(diphosphate) 3'-diphosphatase
VSTDILRAASFAAEKHRDQTRKDAHRSPYINHPLEVASYLADVGAVTDEAVLIAALLHDTIEDTDTTAEEIRAEFGPRVADLVLACSDDKALPKAERKRLQIAKARDTCDDAKLVKIADKVCNLRDILGSPPLGWSIERRLAYFEWSHEVLSRMTGVNPAMDRDANDVLIEGTAVLSAEQ